MEATNCSRKLDSLGRMVIPVKLRRTLRLNPDDICDFYTHVDENGQTWLCIPCPGVETEVDRAKRLLEEQGYTIMENQGN